MLGLPCTGPPPRRLWDPWRAKQQGCFFTPQFVARYMAARAIENDCDAVLDPAVGSGALLLELFLLLERQHGVAGALERVYGVDSAPDLVELAAASLAFIAGHWEGERPWLLDRHLIAGDSLLAPLAGPASWKQWFPSVLDSGGFGAVVMNPPYGQLKVNQSTLPARPGDDGKAAAARDRALTAARERTQATAAALRAHSDYRFAHGGVPDLARFFIERSLSLLRSAGRLACIVPSTFLADHRSARLRRHLLEDHRVAELNLIPEDARLFVDVNQPTCVIVAHARRTPSAIAVRRHVMGPIDLDDSPAVELSSALISSVDPQERRFPNCDRAGARLLARLHEHPRLGDLPWIENLRGELDLTIDRRYIRSDDGLPLVRGDQVERYRSDLATDKDCWVSDQFLDEKVSGRKLAHLWRPRIVGRQCSYLKKPRRLSFALIDGGRVVANSCNYLSVDASLAPLPAREALLYLLAVLNSGWMEWRFRITSSTNHVGNYEIASLPVPEPRGDGLVELVVTLSQRLCRHPHDRAAEAEMEPVIGALFGMSGRAPL